MKKKTFINSVTCAVLILGICTIFSCQPNPDDVCKSCLTERYYSIQYNGTWGNTILGSITPPIVICGESAIEAAEGTITIETIGTAGVLTRYTDITTCH